ncbi:MAG: HIRAN domain-containing protein [Clostridiaceae bacterium]
MRSISYGRDYIFVIWKDPKSRRQYIIGELSKNGKYDFKYFYDINLAIKKGFEALISLDDIEKKYTSDNLFSSFASRLPDKERKDINEILNRHGMDEYDEYKLLKRSGGRSPIDNLEFIDPLLENYSDRNKVERFFYIAGPRHYIGCEGTDCEKSVNTEKNELLILECEPDNKQDEYAIKILNKYKDLIGYVPRYYSEKLTELIRDNYDYECIVSEVNKVNNCNECIRVKLTVYR